MSSIGDLPRWPTSDPVAFRDALRSWLDSSWDPALTVRQWWRRLADEGLTVPTWAVAHGGLGATGAIQQVIEQELAARQALAPPLSGPGVRQVGPVLRQHGTMAQCERLLPPMIRGEEAWCVLLAEPDVEPVHSATLATADGDTWIVTGTKTSADGVDIARRALVLVRTDTATTSAAGLSMFVVDLGSSGVATTSITAPDGGPHTVVAFAGVRVGRDDLVGPVHRGWPVAQTTIAHQHSSLAGRIRRGLPDVAVGELAGHLDRPIAELVAGWVPPPPRTWPPPTIA